MLEGGGVEHPPPLQNILQIGLTQQDTMFRVLLFKSKYWLMFSCRVKSSIEQLLVDISSLPKLHFTSKREKK